MCDLKTQARKLAERQRNDAAGQSGMAWPHETTELLILEGMREALKVALEKVRAVYGSTPYDDVIHAAAERVESLKRELTPQPAKEGR